MKRLHCARPQTAFFLCLYLLLSGTQTRSTAQRAFEPAGQLTQERPHDGDTLLLPVTVTDKKGNYIGGLDKSSFSIYDHKTAQEISFFSAQDEPLSIGVIFDQSLSVLGTSRKQLFAAGSALLRFVKLSNSANEYFVLGVSARARLLADWRRGDKFIEEVSGKFNMVAPDGKDTALYDACYLGIEKVIRGRYRKQALLLISDGMDTISRYKFKDIRERLRETGVPVYSIGVVPEPDPRFYTEEEAQGKTVMEELSSVSGGVTVYPGSEKIEAAFEQIAIELRHQYLLGFKPSNGKADGQWHSLKIKVAAPPGAPSSSSKLSVRSRSGYYAAKNLR